MWRVIQTRWIEIHIFNARQRKRLKDGLVIVTRKALISLPSQQHMGGGAPVGDDDRPGPRLPLDMARIAIEFAVFCSSSNPLGLGQ